MYGAAMPGAAPLSPWQPAYFTRLSERVAQRTNTLARSCLLCISLMSDPLCELFPFSLERRQYDISMKIHRSPVPSQLHRPWSLRLISGAQRPHICRWRFRRTLISTKPIRSSSPIYGPPVLSFSTFPAHTLHSIGCNCSAPTTIPRHISPVEIIVSNMISSGKAELAGFEAVDDDVVVGEGFRFDVRVECS